MNFKELIETFFSNHIKIESPFELGNFIFSFAEEIRQLKSQLDSAESTNASLNKELSSRPDKLEFDRVKEEIAVLLEQVQTGNIEISHLRMRSVNLQFLE